MIRAAKRRYTYAEYLAVSEVSTIKLEYLDGEIYAMAGGTPEHAALGAAVSGLLFAQLGGTCRVFSSDLRVRVAETGLATYPDVTVVCGELERDPEDRLAVVNPKVIVEVPSDGTEDYDRNEKREHYQRIPSLAAYVLIAQRERRIDLWERRGDSFELATVTAGSVALPAIGGSLDVDAVYGGVLA
jgi:Uma2 family endonuclease